MQPKGWYLLFFTLIFSFGMHFIAFPKDAKKKRARYNYYMAKLYHEQQHDRKARKHLAKAVRLAPENPYFTNAYTNYKPIQKKINTRQNAAIVVSDVHQRALMHVNTGIHFSRQGMHAQSRQSFLKALALFRSASNVNDTLLSHLLNNLACSMLMDQAICFNPHIEHQPHITIHMRMISRSIDLFLQALSHFPANPTVIHNLETIYAALDSIDRPTVPEIPYNQFVYHPKNKELDEIVTNSGVTEQSIAIPKRHLHPDTPYEFSNLLNLINQYDEIVLLPDASLSMEEKIPGLNATRFEWMKHTIRTMFLFMHDDIRIGCLSVAGVYCSAEADINYTVGSVTNGELLDEILNMRLRGKTPLDRRMIQSKSLFTAEPNRKMVLVCSDGINTCGGFNSCEIASELRANNIDVHVLSFLVDKWKNIKEYAVYDCMAEQGGGQLLKIDQTGAVETIGARIPVLLYPVRLPSNIEKYRCLGDHYLHSYKIPLPISLIPDRNNGWELKY